MPEADEVLITRFVVEADQALEEAKEFRAQVNALKEQLRELASQMKGDIAAAAEGMKRSFEPVEKSLMTSEEQSKRFGKALSQAVKEVKTEGSQLPGVFSKIGTALQVAFGFGVYQMVGNFVRAMREAIQAGEEYLKTLFRLSASVKALQGKGMNITFADSVKLASDLREQFGTFSKRESLDAVASVQLLTRNFRFNQEQIAKTSEVAAALAIIQGKDVDETARQLALFYSSGYAEALQRAGFAVNRLTVAEEAARMGYGKSYLALTEVQRAAAAYSLVTKQASDVVQLAAAWQRTLAGEIDVARKSMETSTDTIGARLQWIINGLAKLGAFLETGIVVGLNIFGLTFTNWLSKIVQWISVLGVGIKSVLSGELITFLKNFNEIWKEAGRLSFISIFERIFPEMVDPLRGFADIQRGLTAETEEELQQMQDAYDNLKNKLEQIEEDKRSRLIDINQDLQDNLEKIERDGARKRADLARDYANRIAQINLEAARSRASAQRDLSNDLAQIDRDVARRRAEIERKRRDNEITAEERFQERLRRLQEEFLFDLEEAVRARDAKQIRRLQRRFALDKKQLFREGDLEKKERERRFQEELADLARQREQRRQDRMLDFQQQLEDIAIQRQQRLQEAAIEYNQQLADLQRNMAEQRKERLLQYQNQLRDLSRSINDRLRLVAKGMAEEYKLTTKAAMEIYNALKAYFGPGGAVEQLYRYYMSMLSQMGGTVPTQPKTGRGFTLPEAPAPPGFAEGGSFVATRPTMKQFGEKGAELVTSIPLNRLGRNVNKLFGVSGGAGSRDGKLAIALILSPDLEARIVEKSLGEFSDVLVSVERMR